MTRITLVKVKMNMGLRCSSGQTPPNPNKQNPPLENGVPFVSQVSHFIDQKKKEYGMLKGDKQGLIKEIDILDLKKDKAVQNLKQLDHKEKSAMVYLKWYYELKRVLWDAYGINIDDVQDFAKLMHDFKNNGYDAPAIIFEYNSALSLRLEVLDNERKNKELYKRGASLQKESSFWQSHLNTHTQTWNAFLKLDAMGFGLNELQQLKDTVSEIAAANNIPEEQAVVRFLVDVENQYNIKLGFEGKVNEKRKELD